MPHVLGGSLCQKNKLLGKSSLVACLLTQFHFYTDAGLKCRNSFSQAPAHSEDGALKPVV